MGEGWSCSYLGADVVPEHVGACGGEGDGKGADGNGGAHHRRCLGLQGPGDSGLARQSVRQCQIDAVGAWQCEPFDSIDACNVISSH